MQFFWFYLFVMNLISFVAYGLDKNRAIKGKWRIREHTLLAMAVMGGSIGAFAGMNIFHHKTKKKKFSIGVPAILLVQIVMGCVWIFC